MILKTKKTVKKEKRNADIIKAYKESIDNGSQRFAVYELLAKKYDLSTSSIGRIVGNVKLK